MEEVTAETIHNNGDNSSSSLEKDSGAKFHLQGQKVVKLLTKLKLKSSDFSGISVRPENRGLILVTHVPGVDITRFTTYGESYVIKEGVRTTTIKPQEGEIFQ